MERQKKPAASKGSAAAGDLSPKWQAERKVRRLPVGPVGRSGVVFRERKVSFLMFFFLLFLFVLFFLCFVAFFIWRVFVLLDNVQHSGVLEQQLTIHNNTLAVV